MTPLVEKIVGGVAWYIHYTRVGLGLPLKWVPEISDTNCVLGLELVFVLWLLEDNKVYRYIIHRTMRDTD